jgi:hypothetical protein
MSTIDPVLLSQLVTAGIGLITAFATLCVAIAGYLKSKSNSAKLDVNTAITQATHESTNGKMAELVAVVKQSAFAAGQKDQVDREANRQPAVDAAKESK